VRRRVERGELGAQPVAMHHVVGVHAGDDPPAREREPALEGGDEPRVAHRDDPDARVGGGDPARARRRAVRRAVVDDDALPAALALPDHAPQAGGERRFRVERRQDDGDLGIGHGGGHPRR
jgi:hypothetical protein